MRALAVVLLSTLAMPAFAQPAGPTDAASCTSGIATLQQSMDEARAKGQMLRRRQLAEELTALQAHCAPGAAVQDRAAHIAQLEQEIRALRDRLDAAQAQLRQLKGEPP